MVLGHEGREPSFRQCVCRFSSLLGHRDNISIHCHIRSITKQERSISVAKPLGRATGAIDARRLIADPPLMDRDLQPDERQVLDVLLSRDFAGRDELREQAQSVRVSGLSCSCGCPSINLAVDRSAAPAPISGMVVDGVGIDASGKMVSALLFVTDGYLAQLEIYGLADNAYGMPTPASFELAEWEHLRGGGGVLKNMPAAAELSGDSTS